MTLILAFALLTQDEDPFKEFKKRFSIENLEEKVRVTLDKQKLLESAGKKAEIKIEEVNGQKSIVVLIDGVEHLRVTVPKLDVTPLPLPPLAIGDAAKSSISSETNNVNGVSTAKVTIDDKVVYDGPGSTVKTRAVSTNGSKFVEVYVDGKLVYKVGEAPKETPKDTPK